MDNTDNILSSVAVLQRVARKYLAAKHRRKCHEAKIREMLAQDKKEAAIVIQTTLRRLVARRRRRRRSSTTPSVSKEEGEEKREKRLPHVQRCIDDSARTIQVAWRYRDYTRRRQAGLVSSSDIMFRRNETTGGITLSDMCYMLLQTHNETEDSSDASTSLAFLHFAAMISGTKHTREYLAAAMVQRAFRSHRSRRLRNGLAEVRRQSAARQQQRDAARLIIVSLAQFVRRRKAGRARRDRELSQRDHDTNLAAAAIQRQWRAHASERDKNMFVVHVQSYVRAVASRCLSGHRRAIQFDQRARMIQKWFREFVQHRLRAVRAIQKAWLQHRHKQLRVEDVQEDNLTDKNNTNNTNNNNKPPARTPAVPARSRPSVLYEGGLPYVVRELPTTDNNINNNSDDWDEDDDLSLLQRSCRGYQQRKVLGAQRFCVNTVKAQSLLCAVLAGYAARRYVMWMVGRRHHCARMLQRNFRAWLQRKTKKKRTSGFTTVTTTTFSSVGDVAPAPPQPVTTSNAMEITSAWLGISEKHKHVARVKELQAEKVPVPKHLAKPPPPRTGGVVRVKPRPKPQPKRRVISTAPHPAPFVPPHRTLEMAMKPTISAEGQWRTPRMHHALSSNPKQVIANLVRFRKGHFGEWGDDDAFFEMRQSCFQLLGVREVPTDDVPNATMALVKKEVERDNIRREHDDRLKQLEWEVIHARQAEHCVHHVQRRKKLEKDRRTRAQWRLGRDDDDGGNAHPSCTDGEDDNDENANLLKALREAKQRKRAQELEWQRRNSPRKTHHQGATTLSPMKRVHLDHLKSTYGASPGRVVASPRKTSHSVSAGSPKSHVTRTTHQLRNRNARLALLPHIIYPKPPTTRPTRPSPPKFGDKNHSSPARDESGLIQLEDLVGLPMDTKPEDVFITTTPTRQTIGNTSPDRRKSPPKPKPDIIGPPWKPTNSRPATTAAPTAPPSQPFRATAPVSTARVTNRLYTSNTSNPREELEMWKHRLAALTGLIDGTGGGEGNDNKGSPSSPAASSSKASTRKSKTSVPHLHRVLSTSMMIPAPSRQLTQGEQNVLVNRLFSQSLEHERDVMQSLTRKYAPPVVHKDVGAVGKVANPRRVVMQMGATRQQTQPASELAMAEERHTPLSAMSAPIEEVSETPVLPHDPTTPTVRQPRPSSGASVHSQHEVEVPPTMAGDTASHPRSVCASPEAPLPPLAPRRPTGGQQPRARRRSLEDPQKEEDGSGPDDEAAEGSTIERVENGEDEHHDDDDDDDEDNIEEKDKVEEPSAHNEADDDHHNNSQSED
eukprot:PhM_4_TR6322/c0_g1_i1/m.10383